MRRTVAIALASLSVMLVGVVAVYMWVGDSSAATSSSTVPVVLVSADDLERNTFMDPAQWTDYKRMKKEQSGLTAEIAALDARIAKVKPEKTRVIVEVAPPGLPGPEGQKGKKGPPGPRGQQGIAGDSGPKGPRGKTGEQGRRGRRGVHGPRGFRGPRGVKGLRGKEGPAGGLGNKGTAGPPGPRGAPGLPGPTGYTGLQGAVGRRGERGQAGPPGGVGVRGKPGPDHRCKFVDVCGVCEGDESSCANKRTPDGCHAVGDPHYRTFDGFTFNYQNTGEFVLVRHLDDFEVQNKQRVCPNPAVRCNMGVAVRAAGHIIIFYADWGVGSALLDGQQITVVPNMRHDVNSDLSYTTHGNTVEVRWKDVVMHTDINPWANTYYMDIYIDAPARMSNGRSLTGLCWTFDGNINDDPRLLEVAAQFWVGDSDRSLFTHNTIRAAQEAPGAGELGAAEEGGGGGHEPTRDPHHNIEIAFKDDAERRRAEEACSDAHGADKRDCMFDVVAGEPGDNAGAAAGMANLIDHEKLMQVCVLLRSCPAASFSAARLPERQHNEGYGIAFWYIPTDGPQPFERSLMAQGDAMEMNMVADSMKLKVRVGDSQCTISNDLPVGRWSHVAFGVSTGGALTVFIDGKATCTNDGGRAVPPSDKPLFIGVPETRPATGRIARFFYVPLTLEEKDVRRYSERQPPENTCPV